MWAGTRRRGTQQLFAAQGGFRAAEGTPIPVPPVMTLGETVEAFVESHGVAVGFAGGMLAGAPTAAWWAMLSCYVRRCRRCGDACETEHRFSFAEARAAGQAADKAVNAVAIEGNTVAIEGTRQGLEGADDDARGAGGGSEGGGETEAELGEAVARLGGVGENKRALMYCFGETRAHCSTTVPALVVLLFPL